MTKVLRIDLDSDLSAGTLTATKVLEGGGIVLYPTDTTYALGANALDAQAVDRVFSLKGRDYSKPIHVIVRDLEQAATYTVVNELARNIAQHFLPGGLTLVLPRKADSQIPSLLVAGHPTLGIRIPHHPICEALSGRVDFPITTTSANRSGMADNYDIETIKVQLGNAFNSIDLVLDTGISSGGVSTIVAIKGNRIRLIREGIVPFTSISNFVNSRGDERYKNDAIYPGH